MPMLRQDELLIRSAEPDDAEAVVNIFNPIQDFQIVGRARRQARIKGGYVDEIMIEKFL